MLRRWNSSLRVLLADDGVEVRLPPRFARRGAKAGGVTHVVKPPAAPSELLEVIQILDHALSETQSLGHRIDGLRCDVVVADAWVLYDVVDADLGDMPARAVDDLMSAAIADMACVGPEDLVARWQRQQSSRHLVCALPAADLQALQNVMLKHRLTLGQVQGELIRAFNASRHALSVPRAVLAVPRSAGTQLGLIADGGIAAVSFLPDVNQSEPLLESSHALMRRTGFDPGAATQYFAHHKLSGADSSVWHGRTPEPHWFRRLFDVVGARRLDLDLSPTRSPVPSSSWALLVVGTLVLLLAAYRFESTHRDHERQARDLQEAELVLSEVSSGGSGLGSRGAKDGRVSRATVDVVQELQVPWQTLLSSLESAANRNVALLSIEPSPVRRELRIVAEARTEEAMFQYLEALRIGSLQDVILASHQTQTKAPGRPIRFQARARWGVPQAAARDVARGEVQ